MRGLLALAVALVVSGGAPAATGIQNYYLPAWSPDGTQIAFEAGQAELWTANADGSHARRLVRGLQDGLSQIVWPKPNELLYDGNFSVFDANPVTRSHRVVLPAQGSTFATDRAGNRVASTCDRCNGAMVVVDVATGKRTAFGGGNGDANGDPAFSPDGSQLLFSHAVFDPASDVYTSLGLWKSRPDGRQRRRISRSGFCASWSPGGGEIAYLVQGRKGISLWEVKSGGTGARLLLKSGPYCGVPDAFAWSPDGGLIAYERNADGLLSILDVASRHVRRVPVVGKAVGIAWSPDSRRLLVAARPTDTGCISLWEVGADGKGTARVLNCAPGT